MELLFKRSQAASEFGRVSFKLFGKTEFDDEEQALIKKYKFDEAVLIYTYQPTLFKQTLVRSFGVFIIAWIVFFAMFGASGVFALALGVLAGGGFGYWYYHQNRETIFVRDLIHGRHFRCDSVIELAQKEAWLETVCAFLRQVMESAKHWDGEVRFPIEALPKDEAKKMIIKGI